MVKKFGNWEIVKIDSSDEIQWNQRTIQVRNIFGDVKHIKLKYAIRSLKNRSNASKDVNSNTNLKNISYLKSRDYYQVYMSRNNVKKHGTTKTLEEAIKLKEQFLKEFENEASNHD